MQLPLFMLEPVVTSIKITLFQLPHASLGPFDTTQLIIHMRLVCCCIHVPWEGLERPIFILVGAHGRVTALRRASKMSLPGDAKHETFYH